MFQLTEVDLREFIQGSCASSFCATVYCEVICATDAPTGFLELQMVAELWSDYEPGGSPGTTTDPKQ